MYFFLFLPLVHRVGPSRPALEALVGAQSQACLLGVLELFVVCFFDVPCGVLSFWRGRAPGVDLIGIPQVSAYLPSENPKTKKQQKKTTKQLGSR